MINKVLFSSNSDDWSTPDEIYQELDKEFNFNLDPCADDSNHKTELYYDKNIDGLVKNWGGIESFVILLTLIYQLGLKKLGKRAISLIRLSFC